jgi:hypothetical protein
MSLIQVVLCPAKQHSILRAISGGGFPNQYFSSSLGMLNIYNKSLSWSLMLQITGLKLQATLKHVFMELRPGLTSSHPDRPLGFLHWVVLQGCGQDCVMAETPGLSRSEVFLLQVLTGSMEPSNYRSNHFTSGSRTSWGLANSSDLNGNRYSTPLNWNANHNILH